MDFNQKIRLLFDEFKSDEEFHDAFDAISDLLGFVFSNTEDPFSYFGLFISNTSDSMIEFLAKREAMQESVGQEKH